ncbi:MAG: CHRD domain-containing protein [Novosphingobium sp.]|nr:CHRD domain-containing protein [Novosphingobium sp.]
MRILTKAALATLGALAIAVPAAAQFGGPPPPPNTGVPLSARMTGGAGGGNVTVVVDPPKGTVCYIMNVWGLQDITAAHIHKGGPGETGAPVVPLATPTDGTAGACVQVTAEVSAALLANPGGYYVNVHTRAFPQGAIRGQLSK